MSEYQYKLFDKAREIERRFERIGKKVFDKKIKEVKILVIKDLIY